MMESGFGALAAGTANPVATWQGCSMESEWIECVPSQ